MSTRAMAAFFDRVQECVISQGWPDEQLRINIDRPPDHSLGARYHLAVQDFGRTRRIDVVGDSPDELIAALKRALA